MRSSLKRVLGVGVVSGAAFAVWRAWKARMPDRPRGIEWETAPFPFPPVPRSGSTPAPAPVSPPPPAPAAPPGWVEPNAEHDCPVTHPIKGKLASGIFHVPGGANYSRTKPDRCYVDAATAVADGLRPAKA